MTVNNDNNNSRCLNRSTPHTGAHHVNVQGFNLPANSLEEKIWNAYFEELLIFKAKFGHCNVTRHDNEYRKLSNWVKKQRLAHRSGTMPEYRAQLLTTVGFQLNRWQRRSSEAGGVAEGGVAGAGGEDKDDLSDEDEDVDIDDDDDEEAALASGKYPTDGSGAAPLTLDDLWKSHYEQLKLYKQRYNHCNVSRSDHNWKQLGNWVRKQRERYQKGILNEYRMAKLNELNFEWERLKRTPKTPKRENGQTAPEVATQMAHDQAHQALVHDQQQQQHLLVHPIVDVHQAQLVGHVNVPGVVDASQVQHLLQPVVVEPPPSQDAPKMDSDLEQARAHLQHMQGQQHQHHQALVDQHQQALVEQHQQALQQLQQQVQQSQVMDQDVSAQAETLNNLSHSVQLSSS